LLYEQTIYYDEEETDWENMYGIKKECSSKGMMMEEDIESYESSADLAEEAWEEEWDGTANALTFPPEPPTVPSM